MAKFENVVSTSSRKLASVCSYKEFNVFKNVVCDIVHI